jgi:hypothetical protein
MQTSLILSSGHQMLQFLKLKVHKLDTNNNSDILINHFIHHIPLRGIIPRALSFRVCCGHVYPRGGEGMVEAWYASLSAFYQDWILSNWIIDKMYISSSITFRVLILYSTSYYRFVSIKYYCYLTKKSFSIIIDFY